MTHLPQSTQATIPCHAVPIMTATYVSRDPQMASSSDLLLSPEQLYVISYVVYFHHSIYSRTVSDLISPSGMACQAVDVHRSAMDANCWEVDEIRCSHDRVGPPGAKCGSVAVVV
jgi:hypothetical protein